MKLIFPLLLVVATLLACGVLAQEALPAQETNAASQSVDLKVLRTVATGAEDKATWIEFTSGESWGNVGAGMSYSQNSTLTIYTNGEWICAVTRKGKEGRESFEIGAKGVLSMRHIEALRSILTATDAINAKSIAQEEFGQGRSREGPYSTATSRIIIHSNGRTNEIKLPDGAASHIGLGLQNDKTDIRNLSSFLRARLPQLPTERE